MIDAYLDETGSAIDVNFDDRPTNRAGFPLFRAGACSRIFDDATTSRFRGTAPAEPSCVWLTSTRIRVQLATATFIRPGDVLTVRSETVHPTTFNGQPLLSCLGPDGLFKCANGTVPVFPPRVVLRPVAQLAAGAYRSACSDVELYASGSTGGGVYPLQHAWNVSLLQSEYNSGGNDTLTALRDFLASVDPTRPTVRIPAALLPDPNPNEFGSGSSSHLTITFSLIIASRYGGWSEPVSASVTTNALPTLAVRMVAGASLTARRPRQLTVASVLAVPVGDCPAASSWPPFNANDVPVSLRWTISRDDGSVDGEQQSIDALAAAETGRQLVIPPGLLTAGASYNVALAASASRESDQLLIVGSDASVRVYVQPSPLVVEIDGSEWRGASTDFPLELSALKSSYDPDDSTRSLTFTWTCAIVGVAAGINPSVVLETPPTGAEAACADRFGAILSFSDPYASAGVLTVPGSMLPPAMVVRFTATGRIGSRSAAASTLVEVASRPGAPTVSIKSVRQPSRFEPSVINLRTAHAVTSSMRVTITASSSRPPQPGQLAPICSSLVPSSLAIRNVELSGCGAEFQWREISGLLNLTDAHVCPSGAHNSRLVILPHNLRPGARYTLELSVTNDASIGRGIVSLRVPRAPWGGTFSQSSNNATLDIQSFRLVTPVELAMTGWWAEPDQFPLLYSFSWQILGANALPPVETCFSEAGSLWTPLTGQQALGEYTVRKLPAGNVTLRAVVESAEVGSQTCMSANLRIELLSNSGSEAIIRAAAQNELVGLLALEAHRALPQEIVGAVDSLATTLNTLTAQSESQPGDDWRQSMRETMIRLLTSHKASASDPSWRKLQQSQAIGATVAVVSEVSDACANAGLLLIRNTTAALRQADAASGIQDSLLNGLSSLSATDIVASPPPPPPMPPPPPLVPSSPSPPPFPPLWPPLAPAPLGGYSPPPPMRPMRVEDCVWPICGRRLTEEAAAPRVWGSRSRQLMSAVADISDYVAADLEPGDASTTTGEGLGISMALKRDYAVTASPWLLSNQIQPDATVVPNDPVVLGVNEQALAQHLLRKGLSTDLSVLMRLALFEQTPQEPPGAYDSVTPAPMLASPLASVMLRNVSQGATGSNATSAVVSATPGGFVEPRQEQAGSTEDMDIVGVSQVDAEQGMLVQMPRMRNSVPEGQCSIDADCLGLSDRTMELWNELDSANANVELNANRRSLQEDGYSHAGECVQQTCRCPLPLTGDYCEEILECLWWDPELARWRGTGCDLQPEMSSESHFVCNCSLVGSADIQVVVRQVIAAPISINVHVISFDDIRYFANLEQNFMPLAIVGVVDAIYLIGMIIAILRNNERRLRKYDRHYQFWREQHAMRTAKKKTWRKTTWTQMKGQHKLLRVFFMQYELGEDPIRLHTGAQKLSILWIVVLMKLTVSSMMSQASRSSGIRQNTAFEEAVMRLIMGTVTASIALPATVVMDQIFWKQQRMKNAKQMHDKDTSEVQLIARAAMHCTLEHMDTHQVILKWRLVVEEMRVEEMREKLLASRVARSKRLQERGEASKRGREVEALVRDFAKSPSQFLSMITSVMSNSSSESERVHQVLATAAVRVQRRFRERHSRKKQEFRLLCALKCAKKWRAYVRNVIGMRELDGVILGEVVRIQRAFRLHSDRRRGTAMMLSIMLSESRPRVASPKNQSRKDLLDPSRSRSSLVVAAKPFDAATWFEHQPTTRSSVKFVDDMLPKVGSSRKKNSRVALPGALGQDSWGTLEQVQQVNQLHGCGTCNSLTSASSAYSSKKYELVPRSADSTSTRGSISVSGVVVDSAHRAEITFASPLQRLKRRLAINNPNARLLMTRRAHVLATRAFAEAYRGQLVVINSPTQALVLEEPSKALMGESFETVRAVDFTFQLWKEFALFPPEVEMLTPRPAEAWQISDAESEDAPGSAGRIATPADASPHSVDFGCASDWGFTKEADRIDSPHQASVSASQPSSAPASEASDEAQHDNETKPLSPKHSKKLGSKASSYALMGAKRAKVAAVSCVKLPNTVVDKSIKVTESLAKQTPGHAPGPMRRCWSGMCKSVLFWRTFPWVFTFTLSAFCHVQTLFVTMRIFAEFEDPNAMGRVWLQTIGVSLIVVWTLQDPLIIIVRNNLTCTKTIIRSKKYQIIEKFILQPFKAAMSQAINTLVRMC